ncbi:MAG: sigma-70 family RNA polymerase sigma factor, partial [Thermoleophilia bacterium]
MTAPTETPSDLSAGAESQRWLEQLSEGGASRDAAVGELHALLLKAARFEIDRRRAGLPHLRGGDFEDLAQQSADDALVAVLAKLDQFRGESRFTTWAYKFALLEAAVKLRRLAWQGREVPLEEE